MKKLIALILTVTFILTSASLVWAEEEEKGSSNKIEISFKVGDEILKINGADIKVEKPVVINGITLVPLRVISEAFGAQVNWDGNARLVTLDYSGVNIKLYIDNKTAVVDGNEVELLEAPKIINGKTMVPMRFITENFGADVDYQSDTKLITVVKEIVGENSIKDFSLVLKKTNKTKVGDSYHKWSLDFPKTLKLDYRNFTGTFNAFVSVDASYGLTVEISDKDDYTLESLKAKVLDDVKEYTLLNQGIVKKGNAEFVKVVWKNKTSCAEYRGFIEGDKIYELVVSFGEYSKYKGNEEIQKQMDSFSLSFPSDKSTEDLSDVDESGFRPYENKNLKLSFKMMPDWIDLTNEDKENEIVFCDKGFESMFYCTMFSNDQVLTLDQLVEKQKKELEDKYNTDLFKFIKVEDSQISGVDCKVFYYTLKQNTEIVYITDVYVIGKNYIYDIGCNMDSKTYSDSQLKSKIEAAIFSFKFEEPDPEELGVMLNPNDIESSDEMRNIKTDKYACSLNLPVSWVESEEDNNALLFYSNREGYMNFNIYAFDNIESFNEYASLFETKFRNIAKEDSNFIIDNVSDVTEKGIKMKKFKFTTKSKRNICSQDVYLLQKGNTVFMVTFTIDEIRKSPKNIKLLENIWDSMKFE